MIPHEVDYDEGACERCGRKITDLLSLERGFGPVCYKKHQEEEAAAEFERDQMTIDEVV